jgi:hypothetical protein
MAIPTAFDGKLSEIDDPASGVLLQLRTMKHAHERDRPRTRAALRERLQGYVDLVMAAADEVGR